MSSKVFCLKAGLIKIVLGRKRSIKSHCFLGLVFLVLLTTTAPAYSTSFDGITFEDVKHGDYSLDRIALTDLDNREVIFLKTADNLYAKLQITYTKSYSHGSIIYSVSILKGVTYSSSGATLATFENVQLSPQTRISVETGAPNSDGEIALQRKCQATR